MTDLNSKELRQYLCELECHHNTAMAHLADSETVYEKLKLLQDELSEFLPDDSLLLISVRFMLVEVFRDMLSRMLFEQENMG